MITSVKCMNVFSMLVSIGIIALSEQRLKPVYTISVFVLVLVRDLEWPSVYNSNYTSPFSGKSESPTSLNSKL